MAALLSLFAFPAYSLASDQHRAFGIFAYLIIATFVAPFAAARMASARASRFVTASSRRP